MNANEAKQELLKILDGDYGQEVGHVRADDVLCELLESLGHQELVSIYYEIDKWYA